MEDQAEFAFETEAALLRNMSEWDLIGPKRAVPTRSNRNFDSDTGQVYSETIVHARTALDGTRKDDDYNDQDPFLPKHLQPRWLYEHERADHATQWSRGPGTRSLKDTVAFAIALNIDRFELDAMRGLPVHVAKEIWKTIVTAGLKSVRTWQLLARAAELGSYDVKRKDNYNTPLSHYITNISSPTCTWLTKLYLYMDAASNHEKDLARVELATLGQLPNLVELFITSTRYANEVCGPRVMRNWGLQAKEHGAFPKLTFFTLVNSVGWLRYCKRDLLKLPSLRIAQEVREWSTRSRDGGDAGKASEWMAQLLETLDRCDRSYSVTTIEQDRRSDVFNEIMVNKQERWERERHGRKPTFSCVIDTGQPSPFHERLRDLLEEEDIEQDDQEDQKDQAEQAADKAVAAGPKAAAIDTIPSLLFRLQYGPDARWTCAGSRRASRSHLLFRARGPQSLATESKQDIAQDLSQGQLAESTTDQVGSQSGPRKKIRLGRKQDLGSMLGDFAT